MESVLKEHVWWFSVSGAMAPKASEAIVWAGQLESGLTSNR
jgi:hypothetical protein